MVCIGTSTSTPLPITHGVPQGAILSPLLFCIYISDLPLAPQVCNLESFVDNSKIFLSFPVKDAASAERVLEEDLRRVAASCCKNQLLLNPEKTKFLMVRTQQLRPGGGGYSQKNWVGVCGPLPKTLTLFMTKICDNYSAGFRAKSRSLSWGKRSHLSPVPRISE